jgi:hypothetical protein
MRSLAALAVVVALSCCSRSERPRERLSHADGERSTPGAFDWQHPESSLRLGAEASAARIGSFDWECTVSWSAREHAGPAVHASERHQLRQLAGGEFFVESDIDPGRGPGSDSGLRVVWAKGMTYARSRYAPSGAWRERPTDRGRDARRFRDQSFLVAADVADLLGPALKVVARGEATWLGRPARRYALALDREAFAAGPSHLGESPPDGGADEDTRKRLQFLDGRQPLSAEGELLADAATGVPVEVVLRTAFGVRGDPDARVDVDLLSRVTALGSAVGAVAPPRDVLPDERKPKGVARALEAASLGKKKAPAGGVEVEPEVDPE